VVAAERLQPVGIVGYLPQHVSEVGGTFLGVVFLAVALYLLWSGDAAGPTPFGSRTVRLIGVAVMLFGVGMIVASWAINSEPPCGACTGDHWGSTFDKVVLGLWLTALVLILTIEVRREVRRRRSVGNDDRTH
jgi:hypothetical protein